MLDAAGNGDRDGEEDVGDVVGRRTPESNQPEPTESQEARIAVLDPSGAVARWLEEGRGVHVWRNVDLSSASVGTRTFTPATTDAGEPAPTDRPPHWRLRWERTETHAEAFLFYQRTGIVAEFTDTPAGFKAAYRKAAAFEAIDGGAREAPIGTVHTTYTVEAHEYETRAKVPMPANNGQDAYERSLCARYVAAVVRWSTIDRTREERHDA